MKYTQFRAFEKHLQSAAPLHFSGIYCIIGKDSQERALAFDTIKSYLGSAEILRYESTPEQEKNFLRDLDTPSLFQGKQLFYFQIGDKLSKPTMQHLEKRMGHLPPSLHVVFGAETLSRAGSFYKAIEKLGIILEMNEEKPWEKEKGLAEWLVDKAGKNSKTMTGDAVNLLVRGCGGNFATLATEWQKLLTYVGSQASIQIKDIEAICCLDPVDSSWLLGESLLQLNVKLAMEIAHRMIDQGHAVFAVLRQLRHQMMTALQLCSAKESNQLEVARSKFPYLKGQMLDRQLAACSQVGLFRLTRAIRLIDEYEFKAKDTWDDPKLLLNMLILRLTE